MQSYFRQVEQLQKNQRQWQAFTKPGHTVVIAGPGSGKTRVLSLKVAQLLRDEILPPQGVACLTFTRLMAQELEERLTRLGIIDRPNVVVSTVHGFCLSEIVQPFANVFELDVPRPLRVASSKVVDACFSNVWQSVFQTEYDPHDRGHTNYRNNLTKYRRQNADVRVEDWRNDQYALFVSLYKRCLLEQGAVDFGMIIEGALRLLIEQNLVRQSLYSRFPWLAVDEYQDLGYPLFRIVTELINYTPIKLFAIGDPNQAIFDFQGADPQYLKDLAERVDVKPVVTLDKNYRSVNEVINVAKAILPPYYDYQADNEEAEGYVRLHQHGPPWTELNQYSLVTKLLRYYLAQNIPAHRIAVLHRWRKNGINRIADRLQTEGIPHRLDKHPLYDRTMVLIRWLEDLAYWCLVGWKEGADKRVQYSDLLRTWSLLTQHDATDSISRLQFTATLWELQGRDFKVSEWLEQLEGGLGLLDVLDDYRNVYPDEVAEYEELRDLVSSSGELPELRLSDFAYVRDGVQLTTLHSSKGMQFDIVIIAGVECIKKTDNGRRLLYVGMTRAERFVHLLYSRWDPYSRTRNVPIYVSELLEKCAGWDSFEHFPL